MLYIIGLSHKAQVRKRCTPETDVQKAFAECLRNSVNELRPDFIAEEYSSERLDRKFEDSIAKEIALENKITHKFCDPTPQERCDIGYPAPGSIFHALEMPNSEGLSVNELKTKTYAIMIGRYFGIREQFWLARLRECPDGDGIFICGDGHIESFTQLLDANQVVWKVIARRIGFIPGEDDDIQRAKQYLREHPELADWNP